MLVPLKVAVWNRLDIFRQRTWLPYVVALFLTLGTLLTHFLVADRFGGAPLLILFMVPIVVSALLGGMGPGLLATALAAVGTSFFILPPIGSFKVLAPPELLQWSILLGCGLVASYLSDYLAKLRAEAENQRRLLLSIISSSQDVIFAKDRAGRYIFCNDTMLQRAGIRPEDVIGRDDSVLFGPELAQEIKARDELVMASAANSVLEEEVKAPSGELLTFLTNKGPVYDADGRVIGLFGIARDITRRKQVEDELRQYRDHLESLVARRTAALQASEEKFRLLVTTTQEGIWLVGPDYRISYANDAMALMLGYGRGEILVGMPVWQFMFPEDVDSHRQQLESSRPGRGNAYEGRVRRRDGSESWCLISITPLRDGNGEFAGAVAFVSDYNQRRQVEAQLVAANHELQRFAYAASHDLKSPLVRLINFSSLLEQKYRDRLEGDGLACLNFISGNARRMVALVDDLQAHTQIGQGVWQLVHLDVREVLREVLAERDEDIRRCGARLNWHLPDCPVRADRAGLVQVLRSLLDNALKFSSGAAPPVIDIGAEEAEDRYRLWIRDNGIGFNMIYHGQIFEIFRRLHTYEEFPGSGVGLALVKKALERMGGRVWAESAPGEGATFHIELPVSRSANWLSP